MIDLGPDGVADGVADGVEEGIVVHAVKESVAITNTTIPGPLIISFLLIPIQCVNDVARSILSELSGMKSLDANQCSLCANLPSLVCRHLLREGNTTAIQSAIADVSFSKSRGGLVP